MERGKHPLWDFSLTAAIIAALVVLGVAGRLLPHPANFTPVAAAALFAGFWLRSRWLAAGVPLAAMLISNYFEGADDLRVMLAILLAMCFPVLLAGALKTRLTIGRVVACSLASSLVFFLVSNLAVWLFSPMYTQDAAGLLRCFTVAVPFLRNTVAGDLVWTAILFGTHALLTNSLQIGIPQRVYARVRKR